MRKTEEAVKWPFFFENGVQVVKCVEYGLLIILIKCRRPCIERIIWLAVVLCDSRTSSRRDGAFNIVEGSGVVILKGMLEWAYGIIRRCNCCQSFCGAGL